MLHECIFPHLFKVGDKIEGGGECYHVRLYTAFIAVMLLDAYYSYVSMWVAKNFDLDSVQVREAFRGENLTGGPSGHFPIGEVNDLVQMRQQRIDVVGNQEGGHPVRADDLVDKVQQLSLAPDVEV